MSPDIPQQIAHYRINAKLGEGGMGAVYRATDTKLAREVALKLLPARLASDPDCIARFRREAQVLASLNHPNIAAIYGLEDEVIVLELVEGATLDQRLPLPLAEALEIARQIADALEYAHEKGVVHRDLKPANVKITPEGAVKVLDFGLAKIAADPATSGDPASSPTLTMRATQAGIILGTAAYMSPEQAAAKPVDRRADIWSFGVLLWELLTGCRLFEGETVSHTLADVLRAPIHFDQLPADTPAAIRELLRRCLDRDVRTRLRDIGEARIAIQRCQFEPAAVAPVTPTPPASRRPTTWIAAAAILGLIAAALSYAHFTEKPAQRPPMRLFLHPPPGVLSESPEISPDGTKVSFVGHTTAGPAIYVRNLAADAATVIAGTENATDTCWSPDSRRIAFFAQRKLKIVDLPSGSLQTIAESTAFGQSGVAWSSRGYILFFSRTSLFRVPEGGGTAVTVPIPVVHRPRFPSMLPDGHHFLYYAMGATEGPAGVGGAIHISDAEKPASDSVLVPISSGAGAYLPSAGRHGHVLFPRGSSLMALPLDSTSFSPEGEAFVVGDVLPRDVAGSRTFSVSQAGFFGYLSGSRPEYQVSILDHSGKPLGRAGVGTRLTHPAVSPDGRLILHDGGASYVDRDLWVFDMTRNFKSRITAEGPGTQFAIWSADGSAVFYEGHRYGKFGLYRRAPNAAAGEEKILDTGHDRIVPNQSVADRFLIYQSTDINSGFDIWLLPLQGERKPVPLIQTQFSEQQAQVSPDGRWLAYTSDETGESQIYLRSFTAATGQVGAERHQVSLAGGVHPRWSRDGRELYFVSPRPAMMVARPDPQAGWERSQPEELFPAPGYNRLNFATPYDVTPDGRFVLSMMDGEFNLDVAILLSWTPSAPHTPK
jgi:serine/threonine protein kinase/Tol biopolymer transport system component